MGLEGLSALIESDGVLKVHGALLQPGDDFLQLLEGGFKAQRGDFWLGFFGNGSLLMNFSQKFNNECV
jgi:hypothetical protein